MTAAVVKNSISLLYFAFQIDADDETKNNSKYNNCTLECIKLGTCTQFSLKLIREKTSFSVVETTRTSQQKLSQYLFSFMAKRFIVFVITKFKAKKQNKSRAKQKDDISEPSSFAFPSSLRSLFHENEQDQQNPFSTLGTHMHFQKLKYIMVP